MHVIAHTGHWALGLLQAFPLIAVAAFAVWRSPGDRSRRAPRRSPTP
ncbi:MAG: hypothetical protein KY433_04255 [Actinobacteria bacterium]|nr:hypothetical protein [Actinomycetota bacterium]